MIPVNTVESGAAGVGVGVEGQRSREEAREWLRAHGVTVAQWARQHGLAPATVWAVLLGSHKGRRGAAHDAAVLLGMKRGYVGGVPQGPQAGPADKRRRVGMGTAQQGAQA